MKTIFFDLETTDLNFVGQILNYAFVAVDSSWKITDTLHGTIKVSPLQLPSPYAILANRVDLIKHQETAEDTEPNAMLKIRHWLDDVIEKEKDPVKLIGFNSVRFDVPFLRTSMIRNGINPYHPQLRYGDVLHVAQKLAAVNPSFDAMLGVNKSLKLERLCQLENIMQGKQTHESLDDVLITIELAKHFSNNYGIDVRSWSEYEAKKFEDGKKVVIKVFPEKDAKYHQDEYANNKTSARLVCLDVDKAYSLWIDIDAWKEGKGADSISWYSKAYSTFFVDKEIKDEATLSLAAEAREDLSMFNLKNFFPERNCDIEQFIYMMKFNENGALSDAIWSGNTDGLKQLNSKYGSKLYLRYLMNQKPLSETFDMVKKYALYRYGGKMKVNKMDITQNDPKSFHITYGELLNTLDKLLSEKQGEDKKLLTSLLEFYKQSPITIVAGDELIGVVNAS